MDATQHLSHYYAGYDEEERLSSRHGQVEFLTTMHYIERFLFSGARVLEIGAGTGRYSRAIAAQGHPVDALELIQSNIDRFRALAGPELPLHIRQGNALDLSAYLDETYDLTLLLGPMYHLFTAQDQHRAFSEALRVTKKGGVLMTAYCIADASILMHGFVKGNVHQLITDGLLDPEHFIARSRPQDLFQLWRKEEIERLTASYPVQRLHYIAADLAANYQRQALDAMDEPTFELYMRYHLFLCERPDLVGATHHALDILRRLP